VLKARISSVHSTMSSPSNHGQKRAMPYGAPAPPCPVIGTLSYAR
jgi:hypothetical protein